MMRFSLDYVAVAILTATFVASAPASAARIELHPKSGMCGKNTILAGPLEVSGNNLEITLTAEDGETVNVSTPIAKNGTFKTRFQIKSGDGFEIEGRFDGTTGQGKWESVTLSCNGDWKAE